MKKGVDYPGITAVFMCHDGNKKYLLSKRSKECNDEHGAWTCGGGSLEFGETLLDALHREIGEEYQTKPLEIEYMGMREVHREHQGNPTHWIAFDYKVLLNPADVQNGEPHKSEELGWFALEDFPESLHSQFPLFLEKYRPFFE